MAGHESVSLEREMVSIFSGMVVWAISALFIMWQVSKSISMVQPPITALVVTIGILVMALGPGVVGYAVVKY